MTLKPPPRDAESVIPHDHDEILDEDLVIRRISEDWAVSDPKVPEGKRLSTMAFNKSTGPNAGMSVDLKREIEDAGLDAQKWVTTPKWIGSVTLLVRDLRVEEFRVGFDPLPDNPYHGEVWGQFSKSKQRKLISLSRWFVEIPGIALNAGISAK